MSKETAAQREYRIKAEAFYTYARQLAILRMTSDRDQGIARHKDEPLFREFLVEMGMSYLLEVKHDRTRAGPLPGVHV